MSSQKTHLCTSFLQAKFIKTNFAFYGPIQTVKLEYSSRYTNIWCITVITKNKKITKSYKQFRYELLNNFLRILS